MSSHTNRTGMWRSRWAAVGAAVAVTAGAGGLVAVNAEEGPSSSFVPVEPVRILDTRDGVDVGLPGPFTSPAPQDLQVTGVVPTTTGSKVVVPDGATGVSLNITVVSPQANGFVSVRPADAPGDPTTSNLNFLAGDITPNAVTVSLPVDGADAGAIELSYDAYGQAGPTTDILVDVVGYYRAYTAQAPWTIASGQTVVGNDVVSAALAPGDVWSAAVTIPGVAVVPLTGQQANFAADATPLTVDDDASCTGTDANPTAPPGRFCAYAVEGGGFANARFDVVSGFLLFAFEATSDSPVIGFTWAYTAP